MRYLYSALFYALMPFVVLRMLLRSRPRRLILRDRRSGYMPYRWGRPWRQRR
jgi:hypothetical protein